MKTLFSTICLFLAIESMAFSQDETELNKDAVTAHLAKLQDADESVRIESLRALQTSTDARIPDSVLPLLTDTGSSTRRLAARAIGSRWWQISKERVPEIVKVLQVNKASERDDEKNMAVRAIGLLTRNYKSDMFAQSASKKWVIYERRGQPCLIETGSDSENLVGWDPDNPVWLSAAWGNSPLSDSVLWHPKKDAVALSMILSRKVSTVWVWRHPWPDKTRVRKFSPEELAKALGTKEEDVSFVGGFFASYKEWKGDALLMGVYFTTLKNDVFAEHEAVIGWDSTSDKLSVISQKTTTEE